MNDRPGVFPVNVTSICQKTIYLQKNAVIILTFILIILK